MDNVKINRGISVSLLVIGMILLILFIFDKSTQNELETMDFVDIEQYTGKWYSIYEYENFFQNNCECVSAKYEIVDEDTLSVVNKCGNNGDGIKGFATVLNTTTNSKLEVDFGLFRTGGYNIIYVDDNYNYAIVGSKDRNSLWFLSRNTTIPNNQLEIMKDISQERGFSFEEMRKVEHTCN